MTDIAQLSIRIDSLEARLAERDLKKLGDTSGWLEGQLSRLAGALAALGVASVVKDITLLAARFDTMEVVMDRAGYNAGYTGRQMREFEKALQDTGISMLESRNTLTQLATAHIDLSRSAELARGAQDLAVVANINSSEAFQRMVHGIKSGQTEILRTLGLNVQFEEGYKRLAKELGTTTAALTGQQKMNSRMSETLRELANYQGIYEDAMGTAGKQAKSLERYLENLQVRLGSVFQPVYSGMVVSLTNALKGMGEWVEKNQKLFDALGITIENTRVALAELFTTLGSGKSEIQWLELLRGMIGGIGMGAAFVSDAFKGWKLAVLDVTAGVLAGLGRMAEAMMKFAEMMPGGEKDAKRFGAYVEMFDRGTRAAVKQAQETLKATSAVDTWMKKNQEAERIAQEGKLAFDGPDRRDMIGKVQIPEAEAAKANKEADRLIESLREQVDTFGMGKTAVEAYKASLMGLGRAQREEVIALLDTIDGLNWEKQRADDARKAEDDLAEALNRQRQARLDLRFQRRQQLEEEGRRLTEAMETPEERQIREMQRLDALLRGEAISWETYKRKLMEIEKQGGSMFGVLLNGIDLFAQRGADAFTQFAMTGKLAWKDMINSIIADLVRLQAQRVFQQLAGYAFSAAGGWFSSGQSVSFSDTSSLGGLPTGGGGIGSPTGGSWTPGVSAPAGPARGMAAGGGGVNVSVVVNGNGTSKVGTDASGASAGELGRVIGGAVEQKLIEHMRPGGLLWQGA